MSTHERVVVIGNGMAGARCVERLHERAGARLAITVLSAEPRPSYDRIQLSGVLLGESSWEDLVIHRARWYEERGIALHLGAKVDRIDRDRKVVRAGMLELPYDKVLYVTGSRASVLPIPGRDLEGVFVFRTFEDCERMIAASKTARRAAVIGGGLLGLEAARGLRAQGLDVTVVHLVDALMERQLDPEGARYLRRAIEQQGMEVRTGVRTLEVLGDAEGRARGLRFEDGSSLEAEIVVMAAGIVPNAELARDAGLSCERGVIVDDYLRTSDPAIYAVGECVEHRGVCYGLVAPLYEQAEVAAAHLAGDPTPAYEGSVCATKLKVSGVDVFSAGDFTASGPTDEVLRIEDSRAGTYKKIVFRGDRAIGAVLVGDLASAGDVDRAVRSGATIESRLALLVPAAAGASARDPDEAVAALAGDAVICGCNGVTKSTICSAIRDRDLTTRKAVAACTNASRSCGGCGTQVEALLRIVRGKDAVTDGAGKKTLCDCTPLSREEVIASIREHHFLAVAETMEALGWTGDGCSTCRPAINYYLTLCWPGENQDDPRSRLVNERVHANIQKDGTYSVVPRMYGGVTTPDELIRIGRVAKEHDVPTVKITGGQRIDLLGVKKEDLPAVWEALDMPSGFAYAKAVRTVKTCVGSTWCRYGTRDSMDLGIRIERMFENLWTPAKVKMAVNACPRNCAESLIKDVGLIAADSVWEIYVGGNGGVKVRTAELLGSVESDEEALELIGAFLQLYREEATYGERTAHWVERVGIREIERRVVDDLEQRRALSARIARALENRVDPWAERVEKLHRGDDETAREYAPLRLRLKVVA